ncbi:thioredoxin family protein [Haloferula sp. A504]|uniref:thioredoxin family protein n=1 Tax=Haloferula sp. A504 TaxID=3373601 RepID=UPI0031C113B3|nr:thioredoxin family protein [Verrucomicrobiaceae bacterium E54]
MAETPSTFMLKPGDLAPAFRLPDPSGRDHALASLAGPKGLLVVFACNHCPYVIHLADQLGELAAQWKEQGIATVAISSNDVENYPQDAPDLMAEFATRYGWDFPYLYDESQEVAKAYGAACTPDFFLFNAELKLFYAGQFDDSRPRNGQSADGSSLAAAVEALLQGNPAPAALPSTGCNIKWKPGGAPPYFG